MADWFTAEEIDGETFAVGEYRHWEETHCYLVCGKERALLIDTGLGVSDIGAAVRRLTALPVTVVTTHVHWDHIGGHRYFSDIAVHEAEKDWLSVRFPLPLEVVKQNLLRNPCDFPDDFSADDYRIFVEARKGFCGTAIVLIWAAESCMPFIRPGTLRGIAAFTSPHGNIYIRAI